MYWPLIKNTLTFSDRFKAATHLLFSPRLTNGKKVIEFEKQWSNWLGVKYSIYVSSGSTANFLLLAAVKELFNLHADDKVLLPSCTWSTNISPVIQLGFKPIFCDVNLNNFSFDENDLDHISKNHDIKIVFITHLLGLSANNELIEKKFPKSIILEDTCESHGVKDKDNFKRGTKGLGSTFSFYFGHHMSTIEGGMICTNNEELYDLMRMKRSHGMSRESINPKRFIKKYPSIDPKFLFVTDGYNFRNTEIGAVLGLSQLKKLNKMIEIRNKNYSLFHAYLMKNNTYFYVPDLQPGNSSFCLPIILKDGSKLENLKKEFNKTNIEYRPIVSGNLLNHPAFNKYKLITQKQKANIEILHNNGVYIGNNHFVNKRHMNFLFKVLDKIIID